MSPIIGITCGRLETSGSLRHYQNQSYVNAVSAAGGAPLLIPLLVDEALLRAVYAKLDGLLLTGGGDVDARRYGQAPHPKLALVDPLRDQVESALTQWAVDDDLPVLAICRGIQLLNVALGGTLIQDIPSQVTDPLVHPYQPGNRRDHLAHTVHVVGGSRLEALLHADQDGGQITVNSMHHQAVQEAAPGFAVTARASDGVIEAIESPAHRFVVGVQWHPEEMVPTYPAMCGLFEGLVQATAGDQG